MSKLIRANLRRLMLNKPFYMAVVLTVVIEAGFALLMTRNGPLPRDMVLFLSLQFISVLTAIFYSLYLGEEYSDGTVRNKLAVGHKRVSVYFANLITGLCAVTVMFAAEILTGIVVGAIVFEAPQYGLLHLFMVGMTGWFACAAIVALYTMIGMLSSNKAVTAILCVLASFALIFIGLFTVRMLGSDVLSEAERQIYMLLYEVNPSGQFLEVLNVDVREPLKLISYSCLLSAVMTVIGVFGFSKKDIK